MKTISLLCILLACVAPAMAATYGVSEGGGQLGGTGSFTQYTYNPSPDPAAVAAFEAGYGAFTTYTPAPYYEMGAAGTPTAADDISFLNITAGTYMTTGANLTANSFSIGTGYWPWNYGAFGTTYTFQEVSQSSGTATFNSYNIGRPAYEFAIPGGYSIAAASRWKVQGVAASAGTVNFGDIHVLNTDTTVTTTSNIGVSNAKITTEGSTNNNATVNIGNIHLNEQMLFIHAAAGTWNITGNISLEDGAEAGKMLFLLMGNNQTYTAEPALARLNIQESVLDQMIAAGQLWIRNAAVGIAVLPVYNRTTNAQINLLDPTNNGTYVVTEANKTAQNYTRITAANKNYWLRVVDTDGQAGDMVRVHVVPEPATLALLGLGAVLSFRRKR